MIVLHILTCILTPEDLAKMYTPVLQALGGTKSAFPINANV